MGFYPHKIETTWKLTGSWRIEVTQIFKSWFYASGCFLVFYPALLKQFIYLVFRASLLLWLLLKFTSLPSSSSDNIVIRES